MKGFSKNMLGGGVAGTDMQAGTGIGVRATTATRSAPITRSARNGKAGGDVHQLL
jgi:hypothetical protein